jgi:Tfp pilus assembly protein PilX
MLPKEKKINLFFRWGIDFFRFRGYPKAMRKNTGNLMAVFLGILLLVVVILPLVIQLLQNEAKQSVKRQKSTIAFQLAEAAVAKGVAKLTETRKNFIDAGAGIPLSNYNEDREYEDIPGGKYKVKITSGSSPGTVCVTGKGMDSSSREVRAIAAEYTAGDPNAPAIIFNQGQTSGSAWMTAEWGSVKSYNNFIYFLEYAYPRVYVAGSLRDLDENPAPPNTDNAHYWTFQNDMGSPPVPDLAYYKQKAINSIVPSSSTTGEIRLSDGSPTVRNPPNSGYFQSSLNWGRSIYFDKYSWLPEGMGNMYEFRSSTSVIYLEYTDLTSCYFYIQRVFFDVEAIISPNGGESFFGTAVPYHVYGATIPENAPIEYQSPVPMLPGFPTGQGVWNTTFSGIYAQPNHCCYNLENIQLHGYYYGPGGSHNRSRQHGMAQFTSGGSFSGDSKVYFDPKVLDNVSWAKAPLHRISWKEISRSW